MDRPSTTICYLPLQEPLAKSAPCYPIASSATTSILTAAPSVPRDYTEIIPDIVSLAVEIVLNAELLASALNAKLALL